MISKVQSNSTVTIRPFRESDYGQWETYVRSNSSGTVFHLPQWSRAVQKAYGHQPCHLTAWQGSRMVGVLPLFLVKSMFVGRVLISVPYATYGGVVADSPQIAERIADKAKELCNRFAVNYMELRNRDSSDLDLPEVGRYDTFRKELPGHVGKVLENLPRKARAAARNGLKILGQDCTEINPELIDTVYDLYAYSLRRLGSPNFNKKLFAALQEEFADDYICLVVWDKIKPIAGVVSFIFGDEIVPYFSGARPCGFAKNANNVMYLRLMEYGVNRGLKQFDFNRTRRDNRGPYDFKRHHGFEPSPLHYQFFLNNGGELPNLSPSNRKYALAGKVWRRMPIWFTRTAGSHLTKWIP